MMILPSLRRQPMHGYALVQHIKERSNHVLQVEEGSLYPALPSKGELCLAGKCSGDRLVVFGVVDVDQPPLPGFSSVDLGLDAVGGHGRSVFPHRRMKSPVEFRPPRVAVHVDRYTVRLKIA
jgi:hypothetical protein